MSPAIFDRLESVRGYNSSADAYHKYSDDGLNVEVVLECSE